MSAEALGDGLIEALHRLQQRQGWLSPAQLVQLSHDLSVPASRVQGVVTFYHLFALRPGAPHRCGICLGTACWVQGAERLAEGLQRRLGLQLDGGPGSGRWELVSLACVGACSQAPVLLLDGQVLR